MTLKHLHVVSQRDAQQVPARTPMIALDGGQYSVPHALLGQQVWVRVHGQGSDEKVIVVHVSPAGPVEVARHARATPGSPKIDDSHFPPQPAGALDRQPKAKTAAEAEFLALGVGARMWLTEAAAAGTTKMRIKMAEAVALAKLGDPVKVDWALGHAAVNSRFAEADLSSIVSHHARTSTGPRHQASETRSLTQGTGAWSALLGRDSQLGAGRPEDADSPVVQAGREVMP
jgi:hypothetical protein